MRRISITLLLAVSLSSLTAQPIIRLDSLEACPGDTVLVFMEGWGLSNIGAITLYIAYDSSSLEYLGHTYLNSLLGGLLSNGMTSPQVQVGISWSASLSGINIGGDTLMALRFRHKGGASNLHFTSNCELADYQAVILNSTYIDGLVDHVFPPITTQPQSVTAQLSQMQSVSFSTLVPMPAQYQWQIDTAGNNVWFNIPAGIPYFSGENTPTLTVNNINPGILVFDSCRFRCMITSCGQQFSDPATLKIIDDTGLEDDDQVSFSIYPNPASNMVCLRFDASRQNGLSYIIFDALGREWLKSRIEGNSPCLIPLTGIPAGQYYLRIISKSASSSVHPIIIIP